MASSSQIHRQQRLWHKLKPMKHITHLILVLGCAFVSLSALAQWQWLDKDGRKVFSDRAPPATVPEKSILKQPNRLKSASVVEATGGDTTRALEPAPASSGIQPVASAPKLNGVDKELAEKKKKAELLETAKRKADEDKVATGRAENCTRAKHAKVGLDSGVRLGRINKQGEREVMDDAARALEAKRIQTIIESDCK
jgi:hypothetical protein